MVIAIAFLLAGVYLNYQVKQRISACIPINSVSEQKIIMAGKIIQVKSEANWVKFKINLCDSGFINTATVNVMLPLNKKHETSVGQEVTVRNTQGYSWQKEKISNLTDQLQKGQLLAFSLEPFSASQEIINNFSDSGISNCSQISECSRRLEFWNSYGTAQAEFIRRLNSQKYFLIWTSMLKNEVTVFANGIGLLDSLDQFKDLSRGNLI